MSYRTRLALTLGQFVGRNNDIFIPFSFILESVLLVLLSIIQHQRLIYSFPASKLTEFGPKIDIYATNAKKTNKSNFNIHLVFVFVVLLIAGLNFG